MGKQEAKVIGAVLGAVLIIIIIMMLLPSGDTVDPYPNNTTNPGTQGSWSVGDNREETPLNPSVTIPESITFSGTDKYTVSQNRPDIELTNPAENQANFVFTVTDAQTGEVIAKTGTVAPGQYAYVNVFDHYSQAGQYNVIIGISAFSFEGQKLNGANSKAVVTVL